MESTDWLALAFIAFCGLAFRPLKRELLAALDRYAEKISYRLEEARRLREQAQTVLASYKRRQKEDMLEAEQVIARARQEAEALKAQAAVELAQELKRKQQDVQDKIKQAETRAAQEIRAKTVDAAIAVLKTALSDSGQVMTDADLEKALSSVSLSRLAPQDSRPH